MVLTVVLQRKQYKRLYDYWLQFCWKIVSKGCFTFGACYFTLRERERVRERERERDALMLGWFLAFGLK